MIRAAIIETVNAESHDVKPKRMRGMVNVASSEFQQFG